jgi:hypothetical protein
MQARLQQPNNNGRRAQEFQEFRILVRSRVKSEAKTASPGNINKSTSSTVLIIQGRATQLNCRSWEVQVLGLNHSIQLFSFLHPIVYNQLVSQWDRMWVHPTVSQPNDAESRCYKDMASRCVYDGQTFSMFLLCWCVSWCGANTRDHEPVVVLQSSATCCLAAFHHDSCSVKNYSTCNCCWPHVLS